MTRSVLRSLALGFALLAPAPLAAQLRPAPEMDEALRGAAGAEALNAPPAALAFAERRLTTDCEVGENPVPVPELTPPQRAALLTWLSSVAHQGPPVPLLAPRVATEYTQLRVRAEWARTQPDNPVVRGSALTRPDFRPATALPGIIAREQVRMRVRAAATLFELDPRAAAVLLRDLEADPLIGPVLRRMPGWPAPR
jgi:hypothetical protein